MRNITFSADENLIDCARERARSQNRTLNEAFREWLAQFAQPGDNVAEYDALMARLQETVRLHPPYSRDEMNER